MRVLFACGPMHPEPGGVPLLGLGLGAGDVTDALATGWARERPEDLLTLLPLPDGGPGSAQAVSPDRVRSRRALAAPSPLADVREVDLLGLIGAGKLHEDMTITETSFVDAARLTRLPEDRAVAAQEALEGSTAGLGLVLRECLQRVPQWDTLVIGLARTAVHDGGAGLVDALGGVEAARGLMNGRDVVLALADGISLGGLSGAGQGLSDLSELTPEQAQEVDRAACTTASRLVVELERHRPRALPVLTGDQPRERALTVSAWGTGAAGGAAMVLRALGARALPGPRVMASLLALRIAILEQDLVVTSQGEAYDVLADSVPDVVGQAAVGEALPAVLVTGRCLVPRGELAGAGIVSQVALQPTPADTPWYEGGPRAVSERLEAVGRRLARTWSR